MKCEKIENGAIVSGTYTGVGTDSSNNKSSNDTADIKNTNDSVGRGKYLKNLFVSTYGLTSEQSLGVVSAMYQEATNWNPSTVGYADNLGSVGIGQWQGSRKKNLIKYVNETFNKKYTDKTITASTFEEQVSFVRKELDDNKKYVIDEIKNNNADAYTACQTWAAIYEQSSYNTLETYKKNNSKIVKKTGHKHWVDVLGKYTDRIPQVKTLC